MPSATVQMLLQRGVRMPHPESVFVADDVKADRIAPGATLHPGSRISGALTSIGPGSEIGGEAPATVENCQLGGNVHLKGGYFSGATFLDGASAGSASHVRPGTLMEEESSAAHAVGLKQTVLFPFVTLGSLINFCDCLMAGGTSRKNHSEVGSSYIHFNFTPHQDKATASLVGDVTRGVFLSEPPIFLGGQGGLVGPCRIAYGCVLPAGIIHRTDADVPGMLLHPAAAQEKRSVSYQPEAYGKVNRIIANNLVYLGNIIALQAWYHAVRKPRMARDAFSLACYEGASLQLGEIRKERLRRLGELPEKFARSVELLSRDAAQHAQAIAEQKSFIKTWPGLLERLSAATSSEPGKRERDAFLAAWSKAGGRSHIEAVQGLPPEARTAGAAWLQAIVDSVSASWQPAD